MLRFLGVAVLAFAAALAADESWARPGGRHGGSRGGVHHHRQHVHGTLLFGFLALPYFGYPPAYYYGPDYSRPHYDPPTLYVEKFPGMPTPETPGEIFCPELGAYYPEVRECASGWQRVIRPPQG